MSTESIDEALFDSRVVERNIQQGKITRAQYETWLEKLDDLSERSVSTETKFIHGAGDEARRRR